MRALLRFPAFALLTVFATRCPAAEPAEALRNLLRDFLAQPSYAWTTSIIPEASANHSGILRDYGGEHEKSGLTKVDFGMGSHIQPGTQKPGVAHPGYTDDLAFVSERWVFATADGWKHLHDLPVPEPGPGATITRTLPDGRPAPPVPAGATVVARRIGRISFGRPDGEIETVLDQLDTVTALPDGGYAGTLRSAVVAKLVQPPGQPGVSVSSRVENAHGSMKFWARDGHLVRYELSVDADRIFPDGTPRPARLRIARELHGLGTTKIVLPAEVRRKLGDK
jgi:hypothetical protein